MAASCGGISSVVGGGSAGVVVGTGGGSGVARAAGIRVAMATGASESESESETRRARRRLLSRTFSERSVFFVPRFSGAVLTGSLRFAGVGIGIGIGVGVGIGTVPLVCVLPCIGVMNCLN